MFKKPVTNKMIKTMWNTLLGRKWPCSFLSASSLWALPCPFKRNEIWGSEDEKGKEGSEWVREGEELILRKSLSWSQRERKKIESETDIQREKTNCSPDIRTLRAGMKQPLIITINVPLCRHHRHSLRHYSGQVWRMPGPGSKGMPQHAGGGSV